VTAPVPPGPLAWLGPRLRGAVAVTGALVLAACSSTASAAPPRLPADPSTLRLAMYADASTMDPDVYYDVEATPIVHGLYDGLLAYAPDSTRLVGGLATSWTVSQDRLTYTFELRHGVRFHDGASFTSADVVRSFARRTALRQPSGYMLDAVRAVDTPRPDRVVVHLAHPVSPFLDYLASTWGPKLIGPAALQAHAGTDHSLAWLDRHDDGTGPFTLTRAAKGREYVLTRARSYWGAPAGFRQVQVRVIGDAQAQSQELRSGDLDAVLHGYPATDLRGLANDPRFRLLQAKAFLRVTAYVNTHRPALRDPALRSALAQVLTPAHVMDAVRADGAATPQGPGPVSSAGMPLPATHLPVGAYPPGILAADSSAAHPVARSGDASAPLRRLTEPLQVAYTADESGNLRLLAEAVATCLRGGGVDAEVRETSLATAYTYAKDPQAAPDLLLNTNTPDAAHPDTWARIVWDSSGGLNFLAYSDPGLDALLDRALLASPTAASGFYRQAGQRVTDSRAFLDLADLDDLIVLRTDLVGAQHVPAYPWSLNLAALHRS